MAVFFKRVEFSQKCFVESGFWTFFLSIFSEYRTLLQHHFEKITKSVLRKYLKTRQHKWSHNRTHPEKSKNGLKKKHQGRRASGANRDHGPTNVSTNSYYMPTSAYIRTSYVASGLCRICHFSARTTKNERGFTKF